MPNLEDTWLEGYEAAQGDQEEEENPFPVGSAEYRFWGSGWWAGFYEEPPLFSLDGNVAQQQAVQTEAKLAPTKSTLFTERLKWILQIVAAIFTTIAVWELAEMMV